MKNKAIEIDKDISMLDIPIDSHPIGYFFIKYTIPEKITDNV